MLFKTGREGLSENITVKSIVGDFLEHSRLFYFENGGDHIVYGGSADIMVRSFDRRVESLFRIVNEDLKKEAINILAYNLKDTANSYYMDEFGEYIKEDISEEESVDVFQKFYEIRKEDFITL